MSDKVSVWKPADSSYVKLNETLIRQLEEARARYDAEAAPIIAKLIELRALDPFKPILVNFVTNELSNGPTSRD